MTFFSQRLDKKCILSFISLIVRRDNQSRSNLKSSSSSYSGLVHPISLVPLLIPASPSAASGGGGAAGGGGGGGLGQKASYSTFSETPSSATRSESSPIHSYAYMAVG